MSSNHYRFQSVGQTYKQFTVSQIQEIPELQCSLIELTHIPTGAQVMHIANEDPENLFCLSFRTYPYHSNGVAHILEHTVLCGSKKFPVKDPFFSMNRRSLNTFMNALTGADFTCYPAATQVKKDFYNLLDVYLDAVFYPHLNELSFLQEGHRLEFEDPFNVESPLEYKGIVYNEMKGALSSGSARLSEAVNHALFPDITYGYNSGGDPKIIPQLSYEELKQFHQLYYHPSRCLFFFYGNMPLDKHLDFIDEKILSQAEPAPPLPVIPLQPRFKSPVYKEMSYPIAHGETPEGKTLIAFCWLTCHILDQTETLGLSILEIILMDTDASPLKKALLESGLCKQALPTIDTEMNEIPWGITLKGCEAKDADALEKIIFDKLKEICYTGIPLSMIENAIHQLEFHRSEITGDHYPFGLSLFMRSALLKQHGADPVQGLQIHHLFKELRQRILKEPDYFCSLIQHYLIDNPHFVRVVMHPDSHLQQQEINEEKRILASIKENLSQEEKEKLVHQAKRLEDFQKMQEEGEIDLLPKVHLSDIPLSPKDFPLHQHTQGPLTIFSNRTFTNQILYADLAFPLPAIATKDLTLLRLLTVVLNQMGCNGRSYIENLELIQGNTGGIGASISLNLQVEHPNQLSPSFHIRGKALQHKAAKLFSILYDSATSVDFKNLKRFKEILHKHFTNLDHQLAQGALKYAINLSASAVNVPSAVANTLYGLDYYWYIKEIVQNFEKEGEQVLERLAHLFHTVTGLKDPHLILCGDQQILDELKGHDYYQLGQLQTRPFTPWENTLLLPSVVPQGRIIASQVAFTAKVFKTIPYTHPEAPALSLSSFLFDNLTLHTRIREQGGAYGGGAVSNPLAGSFYFYSYRDPNIASTLEAFKASVLRVVEGDFDETDLEEAKMEMIQGLDSPIAPGSQGELAYSWWKEGRSFKMRQNYRNHLLAATKEEVMKAVESHILHQMDEGVTVAFAGKSLLEKENALLEKQGITPLQIEGI